MRNTLNPIEILNQKVVGGTIVVGFLWTLLLKFSDKLFN